MAKQGGMGDRLLIDQYEAGGGIGSLSAIGCPRTMQDTTDITQSALSRILLLKDGHLEFTSYFDDAVGPPAGVFQILKTLPLTDRQITYQRGAALGSPAASMVCKQINYDSTRGQDGSITFSTTADANAFGLEWGEQLQAGNVTQGAAGNGTGIDFGATSTLFGWAAYLHVIAFTGTSVTVSVQDSADNATFANLTGGSFVAATAVGTQRLESATRTATVRRYVRFSTAGTFSNAIFSVNFVRYVNTP